MGMVNIGPISGVMATTDVRGAGPMEWESLTGIPAVDPLVGGGGTSGLAVDVDGNRRVVTTNTGGATNLANRQMDDWRDVFNWRDSPVFWVLVMSLMALGLVSLSLSAKAGPVGFSVSGGKK